MGQVKIELAGSCGAEKNAEIGVKEMNGDKIWGKAILGLHIKERSYSYY